MVKITFLLGEEIHTYMCIDTATKTNENKKSNKNITKVNDHSKYDGMEIGLLYRYVGSYMKKQGVLDKGIKSDVLIKRFGSANIQKLINKNYLIKLADSTVTCNR